MVKIKQIKFRINGLNCESCKTLLETEIGILEGIKEIEVDYQTGDCMVKLDENKVSFTEIKNKIESFNYSVDNISQTVRPRKANNFFIGLLIPFVFIGLIFGYFYINNSGVLSILAKLNEPNLDYGLIFLIGVLASFHCIGMCGGLVVTYSTTVASKDNSKIKIIRPHFQYNFGRFISYTAIGGILGGVGSFFAINSYFSGTLMLIAGIFMVLMAVSLFTNYRCLNYIKLRTPRFIAKYIYQQKTSKNPKSPLIIGLFTGFMPCGPLQAMQLYALGTGSFFGGALSMSAYSLGTIPLMFGFGTFISYISSNYLRKIMKVSAVFIGILALIMIMRGLANFGFRVNATQPAGNQPTINITPDQFQIVRMDLNYSGYNPNILYIEKDKPVRWIINVKQMSRCTDEIILHGGYNIRKKLQNGENIIDFIPPSSGQIEFSCWMNMVWGKFVIQ